MESFMVHAELRPLLPTLHSDTINCSPLLLPLGPQARFFEGEINKKKLKHKKGSVCMAGGGPHQNASQFYICMTVAPLSD
jgi:hypothetical protein